MLRPDPRAQRNEAASPRSLAGRPSLSFNRMRSKSDRGVSRPSASRQRDYPMVQKNRSKALFRAGSDLSSKILDAVSSSTAPRSKNPMAALWQKLSFNTDLSWNTSNRTFESTNAVLAPKEDADQPWCEPTTHPENTAVESRPLQRTNSEVLAEIEAMVRSMDDDSVGSGVTRKSDYPFRHMVIAFDSSSLRDDSMSDIEDYWQQDEHCHLDNPIFQSSAGARSHTSIDATDGLTM